MLELSRRRHGRSDGRRLAESGPEDAVRDVDAPAIRVDIEQSNRPVRIRGRAARVDPALHGAGHLQTLGEGIGGVHQHVVPALDRTIVDGPVVPRDISERGHGIVGIVRVGVGPFALYRLFPSEAPVAHKGIRSTVAPGSPI